VRGYLRRAATVLGLPVAELLGAYASAGAAHPAEIVPQVGPARPPPPGMPGWVAPALGVGAVALVLGLSWWFIGPAGEREPAPVAEEPVVAPFNEPPAPTPAPEPAPERVVTTPVDIPEPEAAPTELAASPATAAEAAAPVEPTAEPAVEPAIELPMTVELRFEFSEDCWVEVTDAREQRLAYRLYRAGDVARLRGVAPMQVFLGNADGVRLTVDDQPVAVRPAAERNGTARLNVGGGTG
jgi:cytoskeleton protein RodZ